MMSLLVTVNLCAEDISLFTIQDMIVGPFGFISAHLILRGGYFYLTCFVFIKSRKAYLRVQINSHACSCSCRYTASSLTHSVTKPESIN